MTDRPIFSYALKALLLGVLVAIGTFPDNNHSFSTGIDASLSWAYNYIFDSGFQVGKHIVFPHGPLAFLTYPLGDNILMAMLVTALLKIMLVFNLASLINKREEPLAWIMSFGVAYFLSLMSGMVHLVLFNLILLYCNHFLHKRRPFLILALMLTTFALFLKAYVAIVSAVIFISYALYTVFNPKGIRAAASALVTLIVLTVVSWAIMYDTAGGITHYLIGMWHLAGDNSSAVSFYPYNNWWVLVAAMIIGTLYIPYNWSKKGLFYLILVGPSLFAAWKHGMARQDFNHVKGFVTYVLGSLILFILFQGKNSYKNTAIAVSVVLLLSINLTHSVGYRPWQSEFFRLNNFIEFATEYDDLLHELSERSHNSIASAKLPDHIIDSLSHSTVDVYPWEYSILPASGLEANWQPRVVVNSYASYTSWLDKQDAQHFNSDKAPEYLIWEIEKVNEDINGGKLSSLDQRYLLNDEPQMLLQLIKNYRQWYRSDQQIILKKRDKPNDILQNSRGEQQTTWATWIDVPKVEKGLIRANLSFGRSIGQAIKSFFYKDEQFWIYMKLDDGSIHKYRIVPKNGVDGLWINPYIYDLGWSKTVTQIMFRSSDRSLMGDNLTIEWKQYVPSEVGVIDELFASNIQVSDTILIEAGNNFENENCKYWNKNDDIELVKEPFSGDRSQLVEPNSYSLTYSFPLDSIKQQDLLIYTDCWALSPKYRYSKDISLVVSIDSEQGNRLWKPERIGKQLIDRKCWNHISNTISYRNRTPDCILKVYVWNNSNERIWVDDHRVMIMHKTRQDAQQ